MLQSTAITIILGPVYDAADGVTPITTATVGQVEISKAGGAFAALNGSATLTHREEGLYSLSLTASDTDTLGTLTLKVSDGASGYMAPIYIDEVVAANPPTAATIASQVRTELATELARIDAAITSRLAAAGYTAPDNASIAAILADTNELQTNQGNWLTADVSALATAAAVAYLASANQTEHDATQASIAGIPSAPSAAAVATQVRTELATELARIDAAITSRLAAAGYTAPLDATATQAAAAAALTAYDAPTRAEATADKSEILTAVAGVSAGSGPTAADIADAVWDEALAGHATAGTAGAALTASGASGDPWATLLPGAYADGTAGAAIGRLNNTPPDAPVVVIPDPAEDASLCTVYLYTETLTNAKTAGIVVTFQLSAINAKSERVLALSPVTMTTNAEGYAQITLQRTDLLVPQNLRYRVDAPALGIYGKTLTLESATYDLAGLIV